MFDDTDDDERPALIPSMGLRLLSVVLDGIICIGIIVLAWGMDIDTQDPGSFLEEFEWLSLIIVPGYHFLCWAGASTTAGKAALKMKLVDENGAPISPVQALLRLLGWLVVFIGIWEALSHPQRRALHDRIAGTTLILDR